MEEKWEDSNIAGIGSEEDAAARKAAAMSDPQWEGAGQTPGLEIWRVENRRTEADTPDFGVRRWPQEEYGQFFKGDSYIILKTNQDDEGKITWDLHFWLGESTTQDEMGVAAYKTVELDDLLDGGPVQYREVMGTESQLFLSYFPALKYMEGGIESGFRHVEPESYVPRLFHVRKAGKHTRVLQVPCERASLNQGDCFVLDAGRTIYLWRGDYSSPFEKSKAGTFQHNLLTSRDGKAVRGDPDSDEFWDLLGGPGDIAEDVEREPEASIEFSNHKLYRLSDAETPGTLQFTEEATDRISRGMLDTNDVFVIDVNVKIFVWVGAGASPAERRNAMKFAVAYLQRHDRPASTPITRVVEGAREPIDFNDAFNGDM